MNWALKKQPDDESNSQIQGVCPRCRKVVRNLRKGAFTSWIFGSVKCECNIKEEVVGKNRPSSKIPFPPDNLPVPQVGKRYEIIDLIGQGGMGVVYKIRDRETEEILALKVLREELITDEISVQRFKQEAMITSRLSHPNVIHLKGYSQPSKDSIFLIMEYVEGSSLEEVLHSYGAFDWRSALDIFSQLACGLSYAHEEGVVHRDLKPSNILISANHRIDGTVKIVDFGITKLFSSASMESRKLTHTGEIFGTPLYMSPEQCEGDNVDVRADIYSLGCIFYEILTGTAPFDAGNSVKIILKHLNTPRTELMPALIESNVPLALRELIVYGCLSRNSSDRYSSVAKLMKDLQAIRDSTSNAPRLSSLSIRRLSRSYVNYLAGLLLFGLMCFAYHQFSFYKTDNKIKTNSSEQNITKLKKSKSSILVDKINKFEKRTLNKATKKERKPVKKLTLPLKKGKIVDKTIKKPIPVVHVRSKSLGKSKASLLPVTSEVSSANQVKRKQLSSTNNPMQSYAKPRNIRQTHEPTRNTRTEQSIRAINPRPSRFTASKSSQDKRQKQYTSKERFNSEQLNLNSSRGFSFWDKNRNGYIEPSEAPSRRALEFYDTNHDGFITKQEHSNITEKRFDAFNFLDKNRNGYIEPSEAPSKRAFELYDTNHDGFITKQEYFSSPETRRRNAWRKRQ